MSFTTCWGRVEKLLATGEQRTEHTKPFFFPIASASGLHKPSTWSRPKSKKTDGYRKAFDCNSWSHQSNQVEVYMKHSTVLVGDISRIK
ncbi:hypothetical protein Taro_036659 [Colocasia esculenta]|uniref:Uncharacterized protein n=1 Tax=Colocasia esculenta TaxID=4460 RepID=A0A843WE00_COLES|nr:hypothetical protein [Colocasia esculenta]